MAAEGANLGFPQLDASTYAGQIFWLFVAFVLLYVLMSKIALPRLAKVLDMRQAYKSSHLDEAGKLNEDAGKIRASYEKSLAKAQQSAADIMISSGHDISDKVSGAESRFAENARNRLLAAEQAIARAKTEALQSLPDISAEIAAEMVEKIADIEISKADAKKAVTAVMKES